MRTLAEIKATARAHGQVWTLDIYKWIDADFRASRLKCFQLTWANGVLAHLRWMSMGDPTKKKMKTSLEISRLAPVSSD